MLNNILFKALLKISKENRENNYIYSDVYFPKALMKKKYQKEKQKQLLYNLDKIYNSKKSNQTTKIKDSKGIIQKIQKKINNEDKFSETKKTTYFSKTDLNNISTLPKVNSQKNNNIHLNNLKIKYNINNNFNTNKIDDMHLTPRKLNSFLFNENSKNNSYINKRNNNDSKSSINFHILKINSPKEKIEKSISLNTFNLKKFRESFYQKKFYKLIRLKAFNKKIIKNNSKESNEDEKNYKLINKNRLMHRFNFRIKSNQTKHELKYNSNVKKNLSISFQKFMNKKKNYSTKYYPMIQIDNFREKYIPIKNIGNHVSKIKEELTIPLPLYKCISRAKENNDIYYYSINKMYINQISEYMNHRINWELITDKNEEKNLTINFSWRYYSNRINYNKYKYNPELFNTNTFNLKKMRMINLFERNYEVGNKKYMFLNLIKYCDKINMNVFNIVPFTIIINNSPEVELALEALKDIVSFINKDKSNYKDIITNRKYNEHFWFDKNYEDVNKQYICINKNFLSEKNYWIIKPTDLYQGKCVEIFSDYEQIYKQCKNIFRGVNTRVLPEYAIREEDDIYNDNETFINTDDDMNNTNTINKRKTSYSKMYCSNEIIIQKYLDNPLLYNKRKFDIRCFVLVDWNLNVFYCREGHLKASSFMYDINNINKNFLSEKNYWIVKPTDLYQGKCIDLFESFEKIYKKCKNIFRGVDKRTLPEISIKEDDESEESDNNDDGIYCCENILNNTLNKKKTYISRMYCSNEIIIQKYLDNPLLYNGRKFDIRCFVLVDYNLNLYFFKEGHLKGSSELYNLNNNSKFIHITNYSLQKKSCKFETYEEGNEISYADFKKFLISQNIPLTNFDAIINQMKLLVEISMKSVGKKLFRTYPVLSFEIFGYDFIIDNEFKPWILEINNNPGLAISSPVIEKIIPRMMDDAFRLTIDKIFNTRYSEDCVEENGKYKSRFKLDGYGDDENVFEFLCNIK